MYEFFINFALSILLGLAFYFAWKDLKVDYSYVIFFAIIIIEFYHQILPYRIILFK